MKDLIIIGAGGFSRELLQWIKHSNAVNPRWNVLGFLDDDETALDGYACDKKIIGSISNWDVKESEFYVCSLGVPTLKKRIVEEFKNKGAKFATIIHPKAVISEFCHFGEGVIITANAKVSPNVTLGNFVTLLGSGVGHDAEIGDYSTISGYCSVNGWCKVGEGAFIGSNAVIAPRKTIGDWAFVGMGSMVINNVKPNSKVMGNPAKRINI
ncbi:MAG: acetyltransferase [Bacteroidia bacterium]